MIPVGLGMGIPYRFIKHNLIEIQKELELKIQNGIDIHKIIHTLTNKIIECKEIFETKEDLKKMFEKIEDNHIRNCLHNWCSFMFSRNSKGLILKDYIVAAEALLIDTKSGICGTADLIVKFPYEIAIIVDYKSGKFTKEIESHQIQLMMYGYILQSNGIISSQKNIVSWRIEVFRN